jgi:TolB-like protein/DNA-binding winged helix-turn-helix (wHTH) protein/Flp pilus assembly protein TadD
VSFEPAKIQDSLKFGDDFELDCAAGQLRRSGRILKIERIPMEVLLFLVQHRGELVTRERLVEKIWGKDVYLDTDNSINGAIRKIRQVLKDDPEQPRFIQTITGKGYRFIAPVTGSDTAPEAVTEAPRPSVREDAAARLPRWRALGILTLATVIVAIVGWGVYVRWFEGKVRPLGSGGRVMLAVLPFENFTGDSSEDYFSDGLTEEMIGQLGNLDPAHLGVIARTSVMHYKHSQESIPAIGRDLGIQYVIEGSVRRDAKRVRITVQLIQVKDQSHLWARQYDRDLGHLLELQEEVAREVANEIEFSLSGRRPIEPRRAAAPVRGANSYETYDLYLKGRYFWNKRTAEGFRQAADYFQQAIDRDSNFGRAYAGLADTFTLMSTWYMGPQNELMPKAKATALRALELDESLADAHASLALIKENYDYDWPGAEKEFRRAIELDPQYATAHQWYAEFLSWQGRFPEAFAESEQARQLDPISLIIATDRASILYESRQYESALKQWRSVLDLDPNYDRAEDLMIPAYLQLGRYDDAIKVIDRWEAAGEGPWMWGWKAAVYARAGHPDEARRALAKLEQSSGSPANRDASLLIAYSGTGQKERALALLQQMYAEHSNAVVQIKVDPMFDPLRSDPRFKDLLLRLGLER